MLLWKVTHEYVEQFPKFLNLNSNFTQTENLNIQKNLLKVRFLYRKKSNKLFKKRVDALDIIFERTKRLKLERTIKRFADSHAKDKFPKL